MLEELALCWSMKRELPWESLLVETASMFGSLLSCSNGASGLTVSLGDQRSL